MAYTKRGTIRVATDTSMTAVLNNTSSQFRAELIDLLEDVAAGVIADNPAIIAAAEAAVAAALANAEIRPRKCVHVEAGKWVWDGPDGLAATHYVLPDDTGALVVRPTVWPVPGATPEFTW